MTDYTIYVRQRIEKNESFTAVLEYIRYHSDSFISWKKYINHLVEINGGKYTRFAQKVGVSKNTVKKWCIEGKKPQNRDDFIKIAFGLNMNLDETNTLLQKYGSYAELYPKDLYDAIILYLINRRQGDFDNPMYSYASIEQWNDRLADIREEIIRSQKQRMEKLSQRHTVHTTMAYREIKAINDDKDFEAYILRNKPVFFCTYDKLIRFIDEFMDIQKKKHAMLHDQDEPQYSLHAKVQQMGLNKTLENAVSLLRSNRALPKRNQLITLGVLLNMTEQDLNHMLDLANMLPLYPRDQIDALMIYLLTKAVEENPELESGNAMSYVEYGSNLALKKSYRQYLDDYFQRDMSEFDSDMDDIAQYISDQLKEVELEDVAGLEFFRKEKDPIKGN